jgi:cell division protein FtsB
MGGAIPERISAQRRLTVILVSFAAFFAIVTWSGRKLLPTVRR